MYAVLIPHMQNVACNENCLQSGDTYDTKFGPCVCMCALNANYTTRSSQVDPHCSKLLGSVKVHYLYKVSCRCTCTHVDTCRYVGSNHTYMYVSCIFHVHVYVGGVGVSCFNVGVHVVGSSSLRQLIFENNSLLS